MGNLKESDKYVEDWHRWLNTPYTEEEKQDRMKFYEGKTKSVLVL